MICIRKDSLGDAGKSGKIGRLQEKVKALEREHAMLEEMCGSEENAKGLAIEKYNENKAKRDQERNALLKANEEILKMMQHIEKQIATVKKQH